MKKYLAYLLIAVLATAPSLPLAAQQPEFTLGFPLVSLYDLDSTSYIYCVSAGKDGVVLNAATTGSAKVITSGSSTTITAVTAGTLPFSRVDVGDELEFPLTNPTIGTLGSGGKAFRVVTAKATGDSITVNEAIDLSAPTTGYSFAWRDVSCGTSATSGWIPVSHYMQLKVTWELNQISLASGNVDFRIECRDQGVDNLPIQVWGPGASTYPSGGVTAAGITTSRFAISIPEGWYECRVGTKITGTDDANDLTTNLEQLTIKFSGRLRLTSQ